MVRGYVIGLLIVLSLQPLASATVYNIEFSPTASRALNLGTVVYPGDHALAIRAPNESNQPASTGSGNVINGVTYDDATNQLTFDFGYGAAAGFSDLVSDWNGGVHIHGNGLNTANFPALNTNAGVIYDLASSHTALNTRSGRITGTRTFTETHEGWLKNNQLYVNIHTITNGGGEIRGQLVIVPEPVSMGLLAPLATMLLRRRR